MKKLTIIALFAVAATAFASDDVSLSQSSSDWDLKIDVHPGTYTARLSDRHTNAVVAQWHLPNGSKPVEGVVDNYKLRLDPEGDGLTMHLDIDTLRARPDWMVVFWNLAAVRRQQESELPLRVGGDVKAPIVINRVEPMYTQAARADRISGIVIIETEIDKTGEVRKVVVLKRLPHGLDDAAIAAVRQWRFKPGTLNGEPVDVIFNLTVNFKIDSPPAQ